MEPLATYRSKIGPTALPLKIGATTINTMLWPGKQVKLPPSHDVVRSLLQRKLIELVAAAPAPKPAAKPTPKATKSAQLTPKKED